MEVIIIILIAIGFLALLLIGKIEKVSKESRCPECRRSWAGEIRREWILGFFKKYEIDDDMDDPSPPFMIRSIKQSYDLNLPGFLE